MAKVLFIQPGHLLGADNANPDLEFVRFKKFREQAFDESTQEPGIHPEPALAVPNGNGPAQSSSLARCARARPRCSS